jgi:hypothetical protein
MIVFILKVTVSRLAGSGSDIFCQLLRQFLLTGLQQRTVGEQADRRGAEHFSGQQHPFMGDGGAALAHQLPGVQRRPTAKQGLKHWATGVFQLTSPTSVEPARTLSVPPRARLHRSAPFPGGDGRSFTLFAAGAGDIFQAVVEVVRA